MDFSDGLDGKLVICQANISIKGTLFTASKNKLFVNFKNFITNTNAHPSGQYFE